MNLLKKARRYVDIIRIGSIIVSAAISGITAFLAGGQPEVGVVIGAGTMFISNFVESVV